MTNPLSRRFAMLFIALVAALFGTSAPGTALAKPRKLLAVLEFGGTSGLRTDVLSKLADEARAGALDEIGGVYTVITRESMAALLQDMGKDATCVEGECEVETARNIGADMVISGEVLRVDRSYFLTLKLHDAAQGSLLGTEAVEAKSPVELIRLAKETSGRLVRKTLAPAPVVLDQSAQLQAAPAPGKGAPVPEVVMGADVDVLVAYDEAVKADRNGQADPAAAAAAWERLAGLSGKNPYVEQAKARARVWIEAAEEISNLQKLLPLESLPLEQRRALVDRFAASHGPAALQGLAGKLSDQALRDTVCHVLVRDGSVTGRTLTRCFPEGVDRRVDWGALSAEQKIEESRINYQLLATRFEELARAPAAYQTHGSVEDRLKAVSGKWDPFVAGWKRGCNNSAGRWYVGCALLIARYGMAVASEWENAPDHVIPKSQSYRSARGVREGTRKFLVDALEQVGSSNDPFVEEARALLAELEARVAYDQ